MLKHCKVKYQPCFVIKKIIRKKCYLPGTHVSGAQTALLALILWAYLIISSDEMAPGKKERKSLYFLRDCTLQLFQNIGYCHIENIRSAILPNIKSVLRIQRLLRLHGLRKNESCSELTFQPWVQYAFHANWLLSNPVKKHELTSFMVQFSTSVMKLSVVIKISFFFW